MLEYSWQQKITTLVIFKENSVFQSFSRILTNFGRNLFFSSANLPRNQFLVIGDDLKTCTTFLQSWMASKHKNFVKIANRSNSSILLVGDSIFQGLRRYHCVWNNYFEPLGILNFGIDGDRIQNILWRFKHGELLRNLQVAVIHCGTNNIDHSTPEDISNGLTLVVHAILERKPNADRTVTGILPRDKHISCRHDLIKNVNQNLEIWSERNTDKNVHLLLPDLDW